MARNSLILVSYQVSTGIIFLDINATELHYSVSQVNWLRTFLITYPEALVSIWIYQFGPKRYSIGASVNNFFYWAKIILAFNVRNLDLKAWYLSPAPPLFSSVTWLLPLSPLTLSFFLNNALILEIYNMEGTSLSKVFNIYVSGVAILLNPWINWW